MFVNRSFSWSSPSEYFTDWCQFYNSFSLSLKTGTNKLECLSMEPLSSQVLEFEGNARTNPIGAPFSCFLLGQAPGVASKC
jgi:hypothetical protein